MLNIRAELKNVRTNQTYTVNHIPTELSKLQIKGEFNIKFPFGFNRGISAEKVRFYKTERQLLLDNYEIYGASANWQLSILYGNLPTPLTLILDFTDFTYDSVSLQIGFKITPLLDRCRNFEKQNEFMTFIPQNFTLKNITPQDFQCNFNHNSLSTSTVTIAGLQGAGLIDSDGLEYNFPIPDKNDALAVFRVTQKTAAQTASYFNLDFDFHYFGIRMWELNGTITLYLKTDYLFFYTDGTHEYVNQIIDSCSSDTYLVTTEVRNTGQLAKNVDLSTLPSDPLKTVAEVYVVVYLEVDAPTLILQNAIRIWCDHIFISHDFVQFDEVVKGVKVSDYLSKVNNLTGQDPIIDPFLVQFFGHNTVITSTNFMFGFKNLLKGNLIDVLEAISICDASAWVEVDEYYTKRGINQIEMFSNTIELTNFSDVNYEPIEQIIDFEIGDSTEVEFQVLPRLFEKRKYYIPIDNFAALDTMKIEPKVIVSGEVVINKIIKKTYDDDLIFLRLGEDANFGSFEAVLNQYYSNKNIIDRLTKLLNSFFTTQYSNLKYRNENNQVITHNLTTTSKLFARYYRNITTPANNSIISALTNTYQFFVINDKKYLPVEYSLNLEPNTLSIKLLEML